MRALKITHVIERFPNAKKPDPLIPLDKVGPFYRHAAELRGYLGNLCQFALLTGSRPSEARLLKGYGFSKEDVKANPKKYHSFIDYDRRCLMVPYPKNHGATQDGFELPLSNRALGFKNTIFVRNAGKFAGNLI